MLAKISSLDYLVIGAFFVITCLIGLYFAWKDRNSEKSENAFVGNRKFHMLPIACSLLVTQISSVLLLGMPSEFYTRGAQYWVYILGQWLGVIVAIYIFIPVFCAVGSPSSFKYIQKRFNSPVLRSYCALTFILTQLLYASLVLFAPCLTIALVVPLSINQLLFVIGGICTFYTAIGGFKTVVITDLFQFLVIFGTITALMIKILIEFGGIANIYAITRQLGRLEQTFNFDPNPTVYQSVWSLFFGIFVLTVRAYGVYQPSVQRYVAMPNTSKAQKSTLLVLPMQLLLIFILSTFGFGILVAYRFCEPLTLDIFTKKDLILPVFVSQTLGHYPGTMGLFLACIFSGSLSTLSSSFNSLAAVCWEDFILPLHALRISKKLVGSMKNRDIGQHIALSGVNVINPISEEKMSYQYQTTTLQNTVAKTTQIAEKSLPRALPALLALFFGICVIGISYLAQNVGGILNAALAALSIFGGQAIAVFVLGMFVKVANYKGVLAGKLCADLICLFLSIGSLKHAKHIIPPYLPVVTTQVKDLAHRLENITILNTTNPNDNLTAFYSYTIPFLEIPENDRVLDVPHQIYPNSLAPKLYDAANKSLKYCNDGLFYNLYLETRSSAKKAKSSTSSKSRLNIGSANEKEKPYQLSGSPLGSGWINYALFKIFSISYLLMTPIGFVICMLVGYMVSILTGGITSPELQYDALLLHPWIQPTVPPA